MVTPSFQYPQYLYALKSSKEAIQQPNGSWIPGGDVWELKAVCREETNGKGTAIQTADGKALVFTSLIQLPRDTARINEGTEVLITREEVTSEQLLDKRFVANAKISGLIIVVGVCQKFDLGRLHCRLWI